MAPHSTHQMMKFSIILLLAIGACHVSISQSANEIEAIVKQTNCYLIHSGRTTLMEQGAVVKVVGHSGRSFRVVYNGLEGAISRRCLEFDRDVNEVISELTLGSQSRLDSIGNTNYPLQVNGMSVVDIDNADGVSFAIQLQYLKKAKTIKYLYITVVPYNAVGDPVTCNIRDHSTFTGKVTGPIKASASNRSYEWGQAWYNNTIRCIKLTKVKVEYMDGTSYTYETELPKILGSYKNDCNMN